MNTQSFDPRTWNLFASVALLASCGSRLSNGSADETSTSMGPSSEGTESDGTETDTTETDTTDTTETGDPSECRSDDDCNTYYLYFCHNGACVECISTGDCAYQDGLECIDNQCVPDPDLPSGAICWYDEECQEFEVCVWDSFFGHGNCTPDSQPPPDCDPGLLGIPTVLDLDAPVLALSFVDVDADGQGELVLATETELLVYEVGVDVPTVSPREPPGLSVQAMVAGQFDAQPGEDLVLLAGAEHHRWVIG